MIINIHKQYLLKKFLKKIFFVSGIFLILILIINLIEEANFLKNSDTNFITPLILSINCILLIIIPSMEKGFDEVVIVLKASGVYDLMFHNPYVHGT